MYSDKVMGISSFLLGPIFLVLGSVITVFVLGLVLFSCTLYYLHRHHSQRRKRQRAGSNAEQSSWSRSRKY